MANLTNVKVGGANNTKGSAQQLQSLGVVEGVIDIAKLKALGLVTGDTVELVTFESGTQLLAFDAEITETLVLGANNAISFGKTIGAPTEYINAQTTTAVGGFGAYVSVTMPNKLTSDTTVYAKIVGDGVTSGKIAWRFAFAQPVKYATGLATKKVYAH